MSSLSSLGHFPTDSTRFSFDASVAAVFDDMADRSIPNFRAAHSSHVAMAAPFLPETFSVLDIGASRGALYGAMLAQGMSPTYVAVDDSEAMCHHLSVDYPQAEVVRMDITEDRLFQWAEGKQFDIVCCNYVLQFLPVSEHLSVLSRLYTLVKPDGFLFFGHKSRHSGVLGEEAHEQYIRWRMSNGYTRGEIEAKTRALSTVMFPIDSYMLQRLLRVSFREVFQTYRYMMFESFIARR